MLMVENKDKMVQINFEARPWPHKLRWLFLGNRYAKVIQEEMLLAEHRICVRHVCQNKQIKWKGEDKRKNFGSVLGPNLRCLDIAVIVMLGTDITVMIMIGNQSWCNVVLIYN
ncbi:hypothetical protein GH714_013293 [Hevea brasiliensis]|uniref:Uncharacterized protein n=1 Tax=Hevea brasiliensis TaxID=3981 RepID=A0A6A6L7G1_HEVBR|nr:hypothetical protein GH714_013293 [Hevea brasiliensis]